MAKFNFIWKYNTKDCKAGGKGSVIAPNTKTARRIAGEEVAEDFGGVASSVQIIGLKKVKK